MEPIGRATLPLRIVGVAGIVLGILALLGTILIPHSMTCTSAGDCRSGNDLLYVIASLGRIVGAPFAAAGTFAIGLSLLTTAFRPRAAPDLDSDPRPEATVTTEPAHADSPAPVLAPAQALWTFAGVLFTFCAAAAVFYSLPIAQLAFGADCDENGCSYSPLALAAQIAGFLAPSVMIASLLIAVLAVVASTVNRHGGIRVGRASERDRRDGGGRDEHDRHDRRDRRDPDAELDELLGTATDDLDQARSRGTMTWRGRDLSPFMRPPAGDGHDGRD
ncbi:hypothetical protein N1027_18175 [Herbiconiux sp. CPCC 205763]|uniref:Uncharacterized protein n=1 Tax=Herbiconiux aconitum TaxID=2970913 RepID=A0ABT2GWX3_9MICO|nr:hypothetical protein [Herbiconiux aconitum]MCS5720062.1 hypothetical protein [Herbiconiux aconitum]